MKTIHSKIKKQIKADVIATTGEVKIRFPKQNIGSLGLSFTKANGEKVILKQWELVLCGDQLRAEVIK